MIISVIEHYEDETSQGYLLDTERATPRLKDLINEAIKSEESDIEVPYNWGLQDEDNESAIVSPPALVEAELAIWAIEDDDDEAGEIDGISEYSYSVSSENKSETFRGWETLGADEELGRITAYGVELFEKTGQPQTVVQYKEGEELRKIIIDKEFLRD